MPKEFSAQRLDVKAFAQAGARLSGHESLLRYKRLAQEAKGLRPDLLVDWQAAGELRLALAGTGQVWLHVEALARLPMECQRCLGLVDMPLQVERSFRFVADEATAEALDDGSEEDLLALSRTFDLHALIEDELLMALPVLPRHEQCPADAPLALSRGDDKDEPDGKGDKDDAAGGASRANPFAALAGLRKAGLDPAGDA